MYSSHLRQLFIRLIKHLAIAAVAVSAWSAIVVATPMWVEDRETLTDKTHTAIRDLCEVTEGRLMVLFEKRVPGESYDVGIWRFARDQTPFNRLSRSVESWSQHAFAGTW
jgi:hypothetical protein